MFSGSAKAYECRDCGAVYSEFLPTSIIPFLLLVFAAFVAWGGCLDLFIESRLLCLILAALFSVGSLIFALWVLTWMQGRRLRNNQCPGCKGPLEMKGAGFVESARPAKNEVMIYLFVIGLPLVINLLVYTGST